MGRYTTARFGETTNLLGKFSAGRRPAQNFLSSDIDATADEITLVSHGYATGDGPHTLTTTGSLAGSGLATGTNYWLRAVTGSRIAFYLSKANAVADTSRVNLTVAGSGTHTISNPVTIELTDLATGTLIPVTSANCIELTTTTKGGISTYKWPTTNIATQPTSQTEFLYQMTDAYTTRVAEGKVVLGGHPDDSARGRYTGEVHLVTGGASLPTAATMSGGPTITFAATTITRSGGDWAADGFKSGQRVQVSGTAFNDGVTIEITGVAGAILTFAGASFTVEGPVPSATVVAKNFQFPLGTQENPIGNLLDARQVALELGLNTYHLRNGSYFTIDFPHDNWVFFGDDPDSDGVEFLVGSSCSGSRFTTIGIFGDLVGRIICERCILGEFGGTVTGLQGVLNRTGVAGTLVLASGGTLSGLEIAARDLLGTTLDFSAGSAGFLSGAVLGIWSVVNMTGGDILGLAMNGSVVIIQSSCTGGTARIGGVGEIANNGGVGFSLIDEVVRGTRLNATVSSRATQTSVNTIDATTTLTRKHITNRRRIDATTTPWQQVVYDDNESTELQRADLKDTAGANITNLNKPAGVIVGELDPV